MGIQVHQLVGGFHDISQRDYAMPKNVDQLRTADNPKLQYKGRIQSGNQILIVVV